MTFVFKVLRNRLLRCSLETCPNLWWRSCSKCYAIDCFGAVLKHVQTCDDVRVQSATQPTSSVHAWNMSKPVMTFVFKVLRNRLLPYRRRRSRRRRRNAREKDRMLKIWALGRDSERARPRTRNVVWGIYIGDEILPNYLKPWNKDPVINFLSSIFSMRWIRSTEI